MILTAENYFSKEADREYLSVSQYKNFMGTIGRPAYGKIKRRVGNEKDHGAYGWVLCRRSL